MKHLYNKVDKQVLKQELSADSRSRTTLSFYKYYLLSNPSFFRDHFYILLSTCDVYGRVYVSGEGINAQISVPDDQLDLLKDRLDDILFLRGNRLNYAIDDDGKSFYKLTIKLKNKIVADGLDDESFDVTNKGKHLNAVEFNNLVKSEDALIVDMRNHYESEVGHFKEAILPDVETFREALPEVVKILEDKKEKHVIMYCTGGIRCEKASAYLKHKGFKNVYQLEGGIIEYARQVENQKLENHFVGKNFVFDDRLGERITQDVVSQCHQCGTPSDQHINCANDACHILFIQCDACGCKYDNCCSLKCKNFTQLPEKEQAEKRKTEEFNGTKFGKGRYKAARKDGLDV